VTGLNGNGAQTGRGLLSLLTAAERSQVLHGFNETAASWPHDKLIHELFEEQVRRVPDAVAVTYAAETITYSVLNTRANRLARYLRARDVGPDGLVGLCIERGVNMVVGLLGVLKAGGAYVPLDPANPTSRLEHVLIDAAPTLLLTQESIKTRLPRTAATVVTLDGDWADIEQHDGTNLDPASCEVTPEHLAYVIYTSGSTGKPKGVMVEHRNIVNYAVHIARQFDVDAGEGSLVCTSISFDLMLTGLYPPLLCGRAVRLCPDERGLPALTAELLKCTNLSPLKLTPSHLGLLEQPLRRGQLAGRIRTLVLGGEPLQASAVALWRKYSPGTHIFNHYGPTETTVGSIVFEPGELASGVVPIGRPIANTRVYILDQHMEPVPIGVVGEIYIAGAGVVRGYHRQPELTAERFLTDPFCNEPQARMYKTGDLGRWRPDGVIEYLGRNDQQIKIRGYRVEPGEIEALLIQHAQVKEAVVIAREDRPGERRLVAYVVPADPATSPGVETLRAWLQAGLPEYMVPGAFVMLERLPITSNGKLDRRALPAPRVAAYATRHYEAPTGEAEETLAGIWQELLHVERVGRQDHFFELGGHSLLATRVISRIRDLCGIELPVRALFDMPTLRQLAVHVADEMKSQALLDDFGADGLMRHLRREIDDMGDEVVLARIAELERELGGLR